MQFALGGKVIARRKYKSSIEQLGLWFQAEHHALLRLAFLFTGDLQAAEDLIQETFIRLYKADARIERIGFRTYARRTLINLSRSRFRAVSRERSKLPALYPGPQTYQLPDVERGAALWEAVQSLAPMQRACIALRFYEDLSDAEIANVLDTTEASVRQQIYKGMGKLRDELAGGNR